MADRSFASLIPRINPSVPGCPQPLMEQAIRNAAIRACEKSLAWRHAETPYDLTPGVHEYFYTKPTNSDVHVVFAATVNDSPLDRLTLEQALFQYPAWVDDYSGVDYETLWTGSGSYNANAFGAEAFNAGASFEATDAALEDASEPRAITQLTPDRFVVLPLPDADKLYTLRLIYALKPKRSSTGMPEFLMDELEDVVFHGALQELLVQPNEAWKDRELASYHAKQFLSHVTERRARANMGNARGSMTVQMRPFA